MAVGSQQRTIPCQTSRGGHETTRGLARSGHACMQPDKMMRDLGGACPLAGSKICCWQNVQMPGLMALCIPDMAGTYLSSMMHMRWSVSVKCFT